MKNANITRGFVLYNLRKKNKKNTKPDIKGANCVWYNNEI